MGDRRLRRITGWALVVAAVGVFIDSWASWSLTADSPEWLVGVVAPGGLSEGSIGLVPAYVGATLGLIGLLVVAFRDTGPVGAAVFAVGVAGVFTFWFSYPERATLGGLGSIVLGVAVLLLPGWGRAASPFWVATGVLGIPELVVPGVHWGPVAAFTLTGAALAVTGAYVLWEASRLHVAAEPEREPATT